MRKRYDLHNNIFRVNFTFYRAKWKKRKKTTNVFRSPGALLPSHSLPPFGSMGSADGLCSFGSPHDTRWSMGAGMTQMQAPALPLGHTLSRQPSLGQGLSVPSSGISSGMSCNINLNAPTITSTSSYQSPYGGALSCSPPPSQHDVNTMTNLDVQIPSKFVNNSCSPPTWMGSPNDTAWRGSSIASLRRKALEHSASMSFRWKPLDYKCIPR